MRCKRIREIILTDYVDGTLKGDGLREVESHLGSCAECRRLAEEARSASSIFKAAPRHEAPPGVWNAIREAISTGPVKSRTVPPLGGAGAWVRRRFAADILEGLRYILLPPRPAFVISTAVALLLFALTVAYLAPRNVYL